MKRKNSTPRSKKKKQEVVRKKLSSYQMTKIYGKNTILPYNERND